MLWALSEPQGRAGRDAAALCSCPLGPQMPTKPCVFRWDQGKKQHTDLLPGPCSILLPLILPPAPHTTTAQECTLTQGMSSQHSCKGDALGQLTDPESLQR